MKTRRHHNNKAYRSTKNGKREQEVRHIAKKLKINYKGDNDTYRNTTEV